MSCGTQVGYIKKDSTTINISEGKGTKYSEAKKLKNTTRSRDTQYVQELRTTDEKCSKKSSRKHH